MAKRTLPTVSEAVDVEKLLAVADAGDRAELTVLQQAHEAALKPLEAGGAPTRADLDAYRAASAAVDALVRRLADKYFPAEPYLENRIEAVKYLQRRGYKIGKSKLYKDSRLGLLEVEPDGTVTERAVKAYARRAGLARRDDPGPAAAPARRDPRLADRLTEIKLKRETLDYEIECGKWVSRESVVRDMVGQTLVLDAGLRQLFHERIPAWIRTGGGDPDKVPEAIGQAEADLDTLLRACADTSGFEVMIEQTHTQNGGDNDGDTDRSDL